MKKRVIIYFFQILFVLMNVIPVSADMGPKADITMQFTGISEDFYVTILPSGGFGPSFITYDTERTVIDKFKQYESRLPQGYTLTEYIDHGQFRWSYMPPKTFRVLIYIPSTDSFLLANEDTVARGFHRNFVVAVKDDKIINIRQLFDYASIAESIVVRLLWTVLIELSVAILFRMNLRKNIKILLVANMVTQIALNIIFIFTELIYDLQYLSVPLILISLIPAELLIFAAEALIYRKKLQEFKHPVLYAFVANALSYWLGTLL